MSQRMKLAPDWRVRFAAAIDAHRPFPFEWGKHDCGILTADCIKAVVGIDIAKNFRGRYKDADSADTFLRMCGYRSIIEVVGKHFRRIPAGRAMMGDVAVLRTSLGPALAPVMGSSLAVFSPDRGLGIVSLTEATMAFRIEVT